MLTCFSQTGLFPPGVWRRDAGIWSGQSQRHPSFDDRLRRGHPEYARVRQ